MFNFELILLILMPLKSSSWAIEFTTVSLLTATAADIDINVTSLVGH